MLEKPLTRSGAIEKVISEMTGPMAVKEFVDRAVALHVSKAKDPAKSVRHSMREDYRRTSLIYLDKNTVISKQLALKGVEVRIPLMEEEIDSGKLEINQRFLFLTPYMRQQPTIRFFDGNGELISDRLEEVRVKRSDSMLGAYTASVTLCDIGHWLKEHDVEENDHLLLTILDYDASDFQLKHEPQDVAQSNKAFIAESNVLFADALFEDLENAKHEMVDGYVVIPQRLAQFKGKLQYPSDHWLTLIKKDRRISFDGWHIRYIEDANIFDIEPADEDDKDEITLTEAEKSAVYRFKAHLKQVKRLWRRIEIQGEQTLRDFDQILKFGFQHDPTDHLSGFWQLIRRGNTKRIREVELATIYPFGSDSWGDTIKIAELGLKPGDRLGYVYDFGDWVGHIIELEQIDPMPETGAEYPRIIAQNKAKYKNCVTCDAVGQTSRAQYICLWCSNDKQQDIWLCETCLDRDHEEHYYDEILY